MSPVSGTTSATVASATRSSAAKIRRLPRGKEAALPQRPIERHQRHIDDTRRGEIAEARQVVLPVRIDERERSRQRLRRLVMIEHDRIEAEARLVLDRLEAGRAAIDGHDERRAFARERRIASTLGP